MNCRGQRHARWLLAASFAGALLIGNPPASAQSAPPGLELAASSVSADAARHLVRPVQFMPGMPAMPGMMAPAQGMMPGGMGPMAMMMTGDSLMEMMAGACTAGLFIGGAATALAAGPAPASAILSSAAVGCGFGIAATAAGVAGMMGWRALMDSFK
jgi:hypothetical protein